MYSNLYAVAAAVCFILAAPLDRYCACHKSFIIPKFSALSLAVMCHIVLDCRNWLNRLLYNQPAAGGAG